MNAFLCFLGIIITTVGITSTASVEGVVYLSTLLTGVSIMVISFYIKSASLGGKDEE